MNIDIPSLFASADRRTLAAVVTHLGGDPKAVPDLRDRARIEAAAARLLPAYLTGEKTAGPPSDEVLQAAMNLAAGEQVPPEYGPMVREQMGLAAAETAKHRHDLGRVAESYAAALEEAAGGAKVGDAVLREVSEAAADVGISPEDAEAGEIARRLAEVELGR